MCWLLTAFLLVSLVMPTHPCCMPAQFEANLALVSASIDVNGTVSNTEGYLQLAYDSTAKIVAIDQTLSVDGHVVLQRLVMDYNKGVQYNVTVGGCVVTSLGPWTSSCFPDSAVTSYFRYGVSGNAVNATSYRLQVAGNDVYLSVDADTCVPIAEDVTNGQMFRSLVYNNVVIGIRDRSLFSVPSNCDSTASRTTTPGAHRGLSILL